jgi:hypothetical protein
VGTYGSDCECELIPFSAGKRRVFVRVVLRVLVLSCNVDMALLFQYECCDEEAGKDETRKQAHNVECIDCGTSMLCDMRFQLLRDACMGV